MNFNISDFVIDGKPVPVEIADKILHYHIIPLQAVRDALGFAIWPSQKSGYRSKEWELSHGRSGKSQHCFINKGAVDLTWGGDIDKLLEAVVLNTEYTRMAVYYDNNTQFLHLDYKKTKSGRREVYSSTPASIWSFVKFV